MNYRDPKPDIQRIEELVSGVKNGDIRLPKFQRPFVWKRKEVLKLLDSIYRGYPIGSILLWYTSERLASERTIADLEIATDKEAYPTNYLLDGQQRLSSLCGALYWNEKNSDSIWNIAFDLDKEEFVSPKDEERIDYFPLNKLLNTSDFITQCKSFEAHSKKEKFFKNAEKLLRSIKDYKIAVVKIGDMTIHEVAPIFERINSTGRKLTIVDLMRAATWKGGFDLNDAINTVRQVCENHEYFNISDSHILRNISACAGLGINREDIDRLRSKNSEQLSKAAEQCSIAYSSAIKFIKSNLPLPTYEFLPYALQLTYLVEFFNIERYPSQDQIDELIKWFWRTSISRYFGTSNTGQNARDLDNIRNFASGKAKSIPFENNVILDRFVFEEFRLNIANSKSFALLLAQKEPFSLTTGKKIDINETLSVTNRFEFHHFFPIRQYSDAKPNVCINVCILNKRDNLEIISQRPSQYFNEIVSRHKENANRILESNYIDKSCLDALLKDNINTFFNLRKELIRIDIERLTGKMVIPNTEFPKEKYDEEDDENDLA